MNVPLREYFEELNRLHQEMHDRGTLERDKKDADLNDVRHRFVPREEYELLLRRVATVEGDIKTHTAIQSGREVGISSTQAWIATISIIVTILVAMITVLQSL